MHVLFEPLFSKHFKVLPICLIITFSQMGFFFRIYKENTQHQIIWTQPIKRRSIATDSTTPFTKHFDFVLVNDFQIFFFQCVCTCVLVVAWCTKCYHSNWIGIFFYSGKWMNSVVLWDFSSISVAARYSVCFTLDIIISVHSSVIFDYNFCVTEKCRLCCVI